MTAAKRDLYIEQGATFARGFFWHRPKRDTTTGEIVRDSKGKPVPGDPYDLTGWRGRMQIRQSLESAAVITATTENGMIIFGLDPNDSSATPDPTNGRIDIRIPGSATDALTITQAKYDLKAYDTQDLDHRLLEGGVIISPAITRDE